jgi:hypothetical protein
MSKRINSTTRTAAQADCEDIVSALKQLLDNNAVPEFAVTLGDLKELPPIKPIVVWQNRQRVVDSSLASMQEQLQQSRELFEKSVASFQEAENKTHKEMADLRQLLQESRRADAPTEHVPPECSDRHAPNTAHRAPDKDAVPTVPAPVHQHMQDDFTVVKRRQRRRKVITGTSSESDGFRGAPEVRSLFVYHVNKETQEDDVKKYLVKRNVNVVSIRVLSHPDAALKSFKVTVHKDKLSSLLSQDFPWPADVRVRRFVS